MSVRELADHLGISPRRVYDLISEGKIEKPEDGIVLEEALGQYHARTSPQHRMADRMARGRPDNAGPPPSPARPRVVEKPKRQVAAPAVPAVEPDEEGADLFDYQEARAKREQHNAELAELRLMKERGELLHRDVIVSREYAVARKLRERILAFPARVANMVPPEAIRALTVECEGLVRELQEDANRVVEQTG